MDVKLIKTSTRYESETNYVGTANVGTKSAVQPHGTCSDMSNSNTLRLWDTGDKFKTNFTVAVSGTYRLSLRVRSNGYWSGTTNTGYEVNVNGNLTTFVGDLSSVLTGSGCYGGSSWGTVNAEVFLAQGSTHYVETKALLDWAGVDYLEVTFVNTSTINARLASHQVTSSEVTGELKVYPNPFKDQITVNFGKQKNGRVYISLVDILGKTHYESLHNLEGTSQETTIQLIENQIKPGMYILRISDTESKAVIKKLVKY